jgi:hypothetical protein
MVDPMTTTETLPAAAVETVDAYLAAWNETDPAARRALVERSLGADLWYRDPMIEADGLDAFDGMIAAVQGQFPGLVMRRTSEVDAHHDLVRFTWALGAPDAEPAVAGVDVAKFDADGKLHRIIGFTPAELA